MRRDRDQFCPNGVMSDGHQKEDDQEGGREQAAEPEEVGQEEGRQEAFAEETRPLGAGTFFEAPLAP